MSGYNGYVISALVLIIALIYIRDMYSTSAGQQNTMIANADSKASVINGDYITEYTKGHLYIQYCAS